MYRLKGFVMLVSSAGWKFNWTYSILYSYSMFPPGFHHYFPLGSSVTFHLSFSHLCEIIAFSWLPGSGFKYVSLFNRSLRLHKCLFLFIDGKWYDTYKQRYSIGWDKYEVMISQKNHNKCVYIINERISQRFFCGDRSLYRISYTHKKVEKNFFFCHYLIYNINKHSTGVIINVIFLPEQVYYIYHWQSMSNTEFICALLTPSTFFRPSFPLRTWTTWMQWQYLLCHYSSLCFF